MIFWALRWLCAFRDELVAFEITLWLWRWLCDFWDGLLNELVTFEMTLSFLRLPCGLWNVLVAFETTLWSFFWYPWRSQGHRSSFLLRVWFLRGIGDSPLETVEENPKFTSLNITSIDYLNWCGSIIICNHNGPFTKFKHLFVTPFANLFLSILIQKILM